MSSVAHHPGEDLLWDYHRGALAAGVGLAVGTHLDLCAHCRSEMRLFDAIGGAMLEVIEPVEMSASALDLALARIERPEPEASRQIRIRPAFLAAIDLPPALNDADIRDRYWAAPGVWMAPVDVPDAPKGSKTYLMAVKAGMVMPEHTHRGREITVMLKGRYSDHKGSYGRGDFATCDDSDQHHSPAMDASEDCLCLVAQDAPIVPQSFLAWALQPFARI